jgi:hypothetical protein
MGMEDIVKIANSWHSAGSAFCQVKNEELNGIVTIAKRSDNKKTQDSIEVHEEQHQFNSLFLPTNKSHMFEDVIEEKRGQHGLETQIIRLLQYDKEGLGIDNKVRDEVLAYYKDGSDVDKIYKLITTSNYYDYPKKHEEALTKFPKIIKDNVARYAITLGGKPAEITEERIKELMDDYFANGYKEDIKKWINSIKVLEDKSYSRDEIIELLFPFTVTEWPAIARRL